MDDLLQQQQMSPKPSLPVNGHDLMQHLNLKPGPILRDLLSAVEDAWYDDPNLSREDALNIARATLEKGTSPKEPDILDKKIYNPETKNQILVRTALKYPDNHPAKIAAMKLLKK